MKQLHQQMEATPLSRVPPLSWTCALFQIALDCSGSPAVFSPTVVSSADRRIVALPTVYFPASRTCPLPSFARSPRPTHQSPAGKKISSQQLASSLALLHTESTRDLRSPTHYSGGEGKKKTACRELQFPLLNKKRLQTRSRQGSASDRGGLSTFHPRTS
jgi:hypothetical protein